LKKADNIVVIGGMACGPKAAARARRCDPKARITIVEEGANVSEATCGLPYHISGVIEKQRELVRRKPDFFKDILDIDVLTRTRVLSIDRQAHTLELLNLKTEQVSTLAYDRLVLATGSTPATLGLKDSGLGGIFTLSKIEDALAIRDLLSRNRTRKAVIVGAGLIGLEVAEAFVSRGLEVTVVEAFDRVLPTLLDSEMAAHVARQLQSKGIKLLLGQRVSGVDGDRQEWVQQVRTESGKLEAGLVLLAVGARPNTGLAQEAGLAIGPTRGISVNHYLQTSDPDIYAGGDCVENVHRITQRKVLVPMGSTANKHGRIIGTNITGGCDTFPGVLGTAVVKVFDYNVARVGLSESQAREAGLDVLTCLVPGDEHADYYPGARQILVKLVADRDGLRLLGGQVVGPGETAKRVDVLATALSFGATADDLANIDLAYAPPYNNAMDPLHHAANVLRNKQSGDARALNPAEVRERAQSGVDFILLDVRTPEEWETGHIEAPQTRPLPLKELRSRLGEFQAGGEIVTYCKTSVRAYQAQRILDGAGFEDAKFLDGSISAWPYDMPDKEEARDSKLANIDEGATA